MPSRYESDGCPPRYSLSKKNNVIDAKLQDHEKKIV
jgi:hypothetical protein